MSEAAPLKFVAPEEAARANFYGLIARLFYAAPDTQLISELVRADRRWKASDVGGREVPVAVVQPHADGAAVHRTARDDVEIVVVIDVDGRDRQRVGRRFEEHVGRHGARKRELEAVRVAVRAASDVIGNDDIGRAVLIEVADRRRPAERPGGCAEPERRLQRS